jgi:hypothetical protein
VKALAVAVLSLVGACAADPPPFTYELYVSSNTTPKVAINGDATFEHGSWDFASYAEANETCVLDVTYGDPANQYQLRPEGCELEGHGPPPHELDRLAYQKVTLGPTPENIISMWCMNDAGGSWGFAQ